MSAGHGDSNPLKYKLTTLLAVLFTVAYLFETDKISFTDLSLPVKTPNTIGTFYSVERVVDGDTLKIVMDDRVETVRLIGINTPETVDPRRAVECFGKEASNRMKDLAEGKNIRLEYDDSQGYRDTYHRILAYVYLEDGQMLNRKMIAEGYAYEYTYLTPYVYQKEFRSVQNLAQSGGKGLWASDSCNGKK